MAGLLADVTPLRASPAFRRLWVGTSLSGIGSAMTTFAVTLQVYDLTHSSVAVGGLALLFAGPVIVIGLLGGSLADAVDRRTLVLVTSGGLAAVSAAFAAQAFAHADTLWLLYLLTAVQSIGVALDSPARRTFPLRLLPDGQIAAAAGLNQLSFRIGITAGPALAGLLAALGGVQLCYLLDTVTFGAALYGLARLPPMPPGSEAARPGARAVVEGLRFVRHHPVVAGAFLADLDATVLGMPHSVFPAVNAEFFGGSAATLGLMYAAPAVGSLLGSALSGPVGRISRPGRGMLAAVVVWGAGIAGFGFSRMLGLTLVLLAVAGAAEVVLSILRFITVQGATPDRLRGRVTAVDFVVSAGGVQLGSFEAGAVASLTTPTISAVSGGLGTIVGAALIRLAVPAFTRYDPRDPVPAPRLSPTEP